MPRSYSRMKVLLLYNDTHDAQPSASRTMGAIRAQSCCSAGRECDPWSRCRPYSICAENTFKVAMYVMYPPTFKVVLIIRPETIVRELGETYDAIFRNYSRAVHSLGPRSHPSPPPVRLTVRSLWRDHSFTYGVTREPIRSVSP